MGSFGSSCSVWLLVIIPMGFTLLFAVDAGSPHNGVRRAGRPDLFHGLAGSGLRAGTLNEIASPLVHIRPLSPHGPCVDEHCAHQFTVPDTRENLSSADAACFPDRKPSGGWIMQQAGLFGLSEHPEHPEHPERLGRHGEPPEMLETTVNFEYFRGWLVGELGYGDDAKGASAVRSGLDGQGPHTAGAAGPPGRADGGLDPRPALLDPVSRLRSRCPSSALPCRVLWSVARAALPPLRWG